MRQRAAADHDLPLAEIHVFRFVARKQHVQNGADAVRKRDAFIPHQLHETLGHVTARINLLHAQHRRDVGHAPRVDMKHRRERHVDVAAMKALPGYGTRERSHQRDGVQHQLPMREVHALGQARRSRRIERRGTGVFVEVGVVIARRTGRQHRLVFGRERDGVRARVAARFVDPYESADRLELILDRFDHGQKIGVNEQHLRARVVDRIDDLRRRQPHVDRLKHGAHHRNRKVRLQIAMTVPVHDGYRGAVSHAQSMQAAGEPRDAFPQRRIGHAQLPAVDDFLVRCLNERRVQQMLDQQRISVGRWRRVVHGVLHRCLLESRDESGRHRSVDACRTRCIPSETIIGLFGGTQHPLNGGALRGRGTPAFAEPTVSMRRRWLRAAAPYRGYGSRRIAGLLSADFRGS
ncbi:hypothetical protein AWB67_07512 [Caballeronia terrestris]|uniref:Uncharacterized protein n=1 Tax=Caballeronia terrestris TaxID=1226301 RepID=A0A158L3M0_9BURK|nr:hypothetical protein AWB67_07512 [Caballeronia terrestris]